MLLHLQSHLHAETILEGAFDAEWDELRNVLGSIDPPLRQSRPFTTGRGAAPKRQKRKRGGREAYAMFPIDQHELNARIDNDLRSRGWQRQPTVAHGTMGGPQPTGLKGDFVRNGVFVEVEFGNAASLFRDLFKFQIAGKSGVGQVGVLVLPTEQVAQFMDQGVATYEQAARLLPYMNIGLQLPTIIVGLAINDWSAVKQRYEEMQRVAESNGLAVHDFTDLRPRRASPAPAA